MRGAPSSQVQREQAKRQKAEEKEGDARGDDVKRRPARKSADARTKRTLSASLRRASRNHSGVCRRHGRRGVCNTHTHTHPSQKVRRRQGRRGAGRQEAHQEAGAHVPEAFADASSSQLERLLPDQTGENSLLGLNSRDSFGILKRGREEDADELAWQRNVRREAF